MNMNINKRYALRCTADAEAGTVWSVGGFWSSKIPAGDKLMTGQQAQEFAKRHPRAQIIDVVVYNEAWGIWNKAFEAVIAALNGRRSTHEERQAARAAGDAAVKAAGYVLV